MTVISAALLLLLVMDPLGNVPFYLTALKNVPLHRHRRVVLRESFIALAVLLFFLFTGQFVLDLLRISAPALTTSGGVILLLIALRMIFPAPHRSLTEAVDEDREPFIVPLAIPYFAGPSALATELLFMSREPDRWFEWLVALILAWSASTTILYFSSYMRRFLGDRGLTAMERLMGMVLVTVSIEMLITGIKEVVGR